MFQEVRMPLAYRALYATIATPSARVALMNKSPVQTTKQLPPSGYHLHSQLSGS